jgi:hypothetical protein
LAHELGPLFALAQQRLDFDEGALAEAGLHVLGPLPRPPDATVLCFFALP